MELYELPEHVNEGLRARSVDEGADRIIRLIVTALAEASELVAQDLGPDRYDDAVSEGGTRWRRARNILERRLGEGHTELDGLRGIDDDNAFHIADGDVVVCFYSARNGVAHPDLTGGSKTKRAAVDQMQQQIEGLEGGPELKRLAVLYEADNGGLREVAVGVLETVRAWDWHVVAFERARDELRSPAADSSTSEVPPYHEQPEPVIPPLEPRHQLPEEGPVEEGAN